MQQGRVMRAAGFMMITMAISRVLGYVRDMVMFPMFGLSGETAAYTTAFIIPDFLYLIIIGGALASAFVPVLSAYLSKEQQEEVWQVSSIVISWCLLLMFVGIVASYIFTPRLVTILAPGYTQEIRSLTIALTRIMLIQPIFMMLAGIGMGILNSHQRFNMPAVGSMLYNLFIVLGGVFLCGPIEARFPGHGVAGFSVGVVIGSIVYLLIQAPALRRVGFNYRPTLNTNHEGFRRLIKLMIPALIGLSVQRINLIVNQSLASTLETGAVPALKMAQKFMDLPIGVFAVPIAVAILPTMARQASLHDMAEYKKSMSLGIRSIAFILLPAAMGLIILREPILRLMFEFKGGNFGAADTLYAGQSMMFYCLGLVFYGIVHVLLRGFYALQDTITPVWVSLATIIVNLTCSLLLLQPMRHMGLPLAFSIAGTAQCALLFLLLRRRIGPMDLRHIINSFIKTGAVCLVMAVAVWASNRAITAVMDVASSKTAQIIHLGACMGLAVLVFFGLAYALRMEEAKMLIDMFGSRLRRKTEAGGQKT
ncbi:MAG: murein biosynthesis integral membrane protein MurJ [Clostridiales bacterium]|nr:murein biosynthesis integral membrane protein MurJ [Clostridiales bacterium]